MRRGLAFVLASVWLLLFAPQANSVTDRVTLAPAEFHPLNGAAGQLIGNWGWGDYIYRPASSTANQFCAQLDIPHGTIIKSVRMHYLDNDQSNDVAVTLIRTNKYTGAADSPYVIWSSGASSAVQYATDYDASVPAYALTNTDACSYHILLELNGVGQNVMRFYGVTVVYEY